MNKKKTVYIRDDLGHAWYFDGEKIRLVLADLESPDQYEANGYFCDSLEDGIELLNEYGYITCVEWDNRNTDEYFDLKSQADDW